MGTRESISNHAHQPISTIPQLDNETLGGWDGQNCPSTGTKTKEDFSPSPLPLSPLVRTHPRTDREPHFSANSVIFFIVKRREVPFLCPSLGINSLPLQPLPLCTPHHINKRHISCQRGQQHMGQSIARCPGHQLAAAEGSSILSRVS